MNCLRLKPEDEASGRGLEPNPQKEIPIRFSLKEFRLKPCVLFATSALRRRQFIRKRSLIFPTASSSFLLPTPLLLFRVRRNDGRNESGESLVDLRTSGCVLHLDSTTLASDQSRFSQRLEMLRQRRLRYRLLVRLGKSRAGMRRFRIRDLGKDRNTIRIR